MDFDLIYQTYFEDVFLYLRGLSNSETIAEEITQETFMKALKALDRFDGSKDIKAWLFTIIIHPPKIIICGLVVQEIIKEHGKTVLIMFRNA